MEPKQRSDLPPEFERHLEQAKALSGALRDRALQQLARDYPEHAALLSGLLAADHSQVVLGSGDESSVRDRLRRLAARGTAGAGRYELHGEVARGGMGAILRAFDPDLGRALAMKVVLGEREVEGGCVDPQVLERFVEEAQITGQLDHPGVVPVHELGLDEKGRVYFTMRLVKGITAQDVFALTRSRAGGWTLTRALEVLLKVCDTLAYAHSKGVVHRDLKPSNVMVGKYGEVYVMDWGLAKVLGQKDAHDLRIRPPHSTSMSRVRTDRSKEHESDPDTALRTMDGAIVGTPCYMPPEQAHGHVEHVGVRSDVYAAGAMLYSLLTGTQPYIRSGSKTSPYMVLELVRSGPPVPVHQLDRTAPVELVAICERAMEREIAARYASMTELADDLRAFLENRVVRAYRTGARAELASWVRRNRGMAFGMLTAALALVLGGAGAVVYAGQATKAEHDAKQALMTAEIEKGRADEARKEAVQALQDYREEQRRKAELEDKLRRERVAGVIQQSQLDASRKEDAKAVVRETLAIERLQAIDLLLETVAGGSAEMLATLADGRAEPGLAQMLRQVSQWEEPSWNRFVRGCLLLARGPESALAELAAAAPGCDSAALGMAVQRMIAAVHSQAGRPTEALAAHRAAAEIGTSRSFDLLESLSAAKHELILRKERENAREAAALLLDGAGASVSSPELARAAKAWPARPPWNEPELVMEAARSLAAGDCLPVTQDRVLWTIAPELWAYGKRRLGQPGVAIRGLSEHWDEAAPLKVRTAMVAEAARAWLATHRPHRALAVLDRHLEKYRAGSAFLPEFRPLHELRARSLELSGRPEVAPEPARTAGVRAPADERIEVLLQQSRTALERGDKAASAKALDALEDVLPLVEDRWLLARARVQLAAGFAALDRRRAALPQLDRAARSLQDWLLDYGRFHGEPLGAAQVDVLRALGRSAIVVLADVAGDLKAEDMGAAWQVIETFRSPVDLALGTRPASLHAPGSDATAYETARANWLDRQLQAQARTGATRQRRGEGSRVNSETLHQLEERLRSRAPAYMGAALPRIPSLSDARSALPEGTALVVFATSGARAVAFVLTRGGASLVPLTVPPGLHGTGAPASPEGSGTALLAPVLACGALVDAAARRRLLIAPVEDLCAVPFEFCAVAAPGDQAAQRRLLVEQCEVACVPSGTAWFDQRLQQQGARRGAARAGVALVATDEAGGEWMGTFVPAFAGERDQRVPAGGDEMFETLRKASASWRAIGFSLSVEVPPGGRPPAAFVAAGPRERPLTRQDLRDLGVAAGLAIVAIDRAPLGDIPEAEVLAGFARGLWSGGAASVITVPAQCPREPAGDLVAAVAAAQRDGNDAVTAWCEAARRMLGRGVPIASLCGLRLWSVNP